MLDSANATDAQEFPAVRFAGMRFTPLTIDETATVLAARNPTAPFASYVTPNIQHIYLNRRNRPFAAACEKAAISTNDSRIIHRVGAMAGLELKFAAGSLVVDRLFRAHIRPEDAITIIGVTTQMVETLRADFGLAHIAHHIPPMGFINDEAAIRAAIDFIATNPARYVFVAVGTPQSEILCQRVIDDGRSQGVGLCIGSSLSVLSGTTDAAPIWMANAGLIWLYRLCQEPRRLWRRYLVENLQGLAICLADVIPARLRRRGDD